MSTSSLTVKSFKGVSKVEKVSRNCPRELIRCEMTRVRAQVINEVKEFEKKKKKNISMKRLTAL